MIKISIKIVLIYKTQKLEITETKSHSWAQNCFFFGLSKLLLFFVTVLKYFSKRGMFNWLTILILVN